MYSNKSQFSKKLMSKYVITGEKGKRIFQLY